MHEVFVPSHRLKRHHIGALRANIGRTQFVFANVRLETFKMVNVVWVAFKLDEFGCLRLGILQISICIILFKRIWVQSAFAKETFNCIRLNFVPLTRPKILNDVSVLATNQPEFVLVEVF